MTEATTRLNAKEAVARAFEHFDELFSDSDISHVLLEGVDFREDQQLWIVTIGFDAGRRRREGAALLLAGDAPIREKRELSLDAATGEFVRMR